MMKLKDTKGRAFLIILFDDFDGETFPQMVSKLMDNTIANYEMIRSSAPIPTVNFSPVPIQTHCNP